MIIPRLNKNFYIELCLAEFPLLALTLCCEHKGNRRRLFDATKDKLLRKKRKKEVDFSYYSGTFSVDL